MYKSFLLRTFYGVYTYIYISSGVKNTMAYRTNFNTCYTAFWFSGVSTHTRYSGMSQPPPRRPSCRPRVPTRRPLGSGRTTHRRATLFLILKFYVSTDPPPPIGPSLGRPWTASKFCEFHRPIVIGDSSFLINRRTPHVYSSVRFRTVTSKISIIRGVFRRCAMRER